MWWWEPIYRIVIAQSWHLRSVYTCSLCMRFPHSIVIFDKLTHFTANKLSYYKTLHILINACKFFFDNLGLFLNKMVVFQKREKIFLGVKKYFIIFSFWLMFVTAVNLWNFWLYYMFSFWAKLRQAYLNKSLSSKFLVKRKKWAQYTWCWISLIYYYSNLVKSKDSWTIITRWSSLVLLFIGNV